jgi:hypothetical protein
VCSALLCVPTGCLASAVDRSVVENSVHRAAVSWVQILPEVFPMDLTQVCVSYRFAHPCFGHPRQLEK